MRLPNQLDLFEAIVRVRVYIQLRLPSQLYYLFEAIGRVYTQVRLPSQLYLFEAIVRVCVYTQLRLLSQLYHLRIMSSQNCESTLPPTNTS